MSDYQSRIQTKADVLTAKDLNAALEYTEDVMTKILTEGKKFDQDKPMIGLIPSIAIEEEAAVYTFGMKKYGMWNWSKGLSYIRLISATLRHIFAFLRGEDFDPESGLPHLAHARASLGMIRHLQVSGRTDLDDRLGKTCK